MELYNKFLECGVITTDSRDCPKDSMFFALRGDSFDGNQYALSALEKGCAYAVVDDPKVAVDNRFIVVDNVLKALQDMAAEHRKALGTTIVGITGTNGKTTTKELVSTVLNKKGNVLYTQGNFNNHIGVPKTLLQITPQHKIAVVEMGANHPGEIKTLVNIARPDYGLITNVGRAHLEGFGSFEGVKRTKGELYDFLRDNGGMAFLYSDSEDLTTMATERELKTIGYGLSKKDTNYVSGQIIKDGTPYLSAKVECFDEEIEIHTKLIGDYNISNLLSAVCVGRFFDVPMRDIKAALEEYTPSNNRSQLVKTVSNTLIVDAYNANPTSMTAAIKNFINMDAEHKCAILGDMGELGADSETEHQNIVSLLQSAGFEQVILVGKRFGATDHTFLNFDNVDTLKEFIKKEPIIGRTILIKGSNSMKMFTLPEIL